MLAWRVSNHVALDGEGGLHASARWHSKGRRVLYCAPNPATALLEMLVHAQIDIEDFPLTFRLLKIEIADRLAAQEVGAKDLPADWTADVTASRAIGDAWLAARRCALLFVPSAIVPETNNILINPEHRDARRVKLASATNYPLDQRLTPA